MTVPEARTTTRVLTGVSVVVVGVWVVILAVWTDAPFALTFDDAYYYFGIARHLAAGEGSTFDGINATNGYHPLWLALAVPVFKAGLDDQAAVRVLLALQIVIGWGGALVLMSRLIGRAVAGWPRLSSRARTSSLVATTVLGSVFALAAGNPYVLRTFTNGLESGVAVLIDSALLAVVAGGASGGPRARTAGDTDRVRDPSASRRGGPGTGRWLVGSTRWRLGVSVLLSLAFLARIDAALLLAVVGIWCLAEARAEQRAGRAWLAPLTEVLALPTLTVATYLVANRLAFGTALPVSGLHKQADLTILTGVGLVATVGGAVGVGRWAFRRVTVTAESRPPRQRRVAAFAARSGWFAAFSVLVVGYYVLAQNQIWLWYFAPVALWGLVAFLLFVADAVEDTLAGAGRRSPTRAIAPLAAILTVPLVLALGFGFTSLADPEVLSIQKANSEAGAWIRANLGDDAVLASWDAGVVGYFSHRPVVNLDGVVNSYDYYQATRQGPEAVRAFLDRSGVSYIVNHGDEVAGGDPDIVSYIRTIWGPEAAEGATVVHRQPFRYRGTTTGSGGFTNQDGSRAMAVFVYRLAAIS